MTIEDMIDCVLRMERQREFIRKFNRSDHRWHIDAGHVSCDDIEMHWGQWGVGLIYNNGYGDDSAEWEDAMRLLVTNAALHRILELCMSLPDFTVRP